MAIIILILLLVALVLFDLVALRWGVDTTEDRRSRMGASPSLGGAMSLGRLGQRQGKQAEAYTLVADIYQRAWVAVLAGAGLLASGWLLWGKRRCV